MGREVVADVYHSASNDPSHSVNEQAVWRDDQDELAAGGSVGELLHLHDLTHRDRRFHRGSRHHHACSAARQLSFEVPQTVSVRPLHAMAQEHSVGAEHP